MRGTALPKGHFIGQIPPNWNEYLQGGTWKDAHNNRVKVRIPAKHSKSGEIPDSDLPWAIVQQSTFTGMRNGASVGLWGGEWVKGYFLDEGEQIPVITGVLSVNIVDGEIKNSENGSTGFRKVKRFNGGFIAQAYQMVGGPKPKAPAVPSKEDFEKATQGMGKGSESDAELEAAETGEELPGFVPPEEAAKPQAAAELSPSNPDSGGTGDWVLEPSGGFPPGYTPPGYVPPKKYAEPLPEIEIKTSPGGQKYQLIPSGLEAGVERRYLE